MVEKPGASHEIVLESVHVVTLAPLLGQLQAEPPHLTVSQVLEYADALCVMLGQSGDAIVADQIFRMFLVKAAPD